MPQQPEGPVRLRQVCAYRCIVSHESALLQDFSLCILQEHNCLGKDVRAPAYTRRPHTVQCRDSDELSGLGAAHALCYTQSAGAAQQPALRPVRSLLVQQRSPAYRSAPARRRRAHLSGCCGRRRASPRCRTRHPWPASAVRR